MRTTHVMLGAAALAAALAVQAIAGPLPTVEFDNKYQGRIETDPNTYFGFNISKKQGKKKVAKVTANPRYNCEGGKSGYVAGRVKGKLALDDDDHFAGTLRGEAPAARGTGFRIKYRLNGKLVTKRKARGTIDAELRFSGKARGGETVRCYSGEVDWKARRGAQVPVPD